MDVQVAGPNEFENVKQALRLVHEISRINAELDPSAPADWILKRLLFLAYEFESTIPDTEDHDKLRLLNQFLFSRKSFRCATESKLSEDPGEACRLGSVLGSRVGSASAISLIYAFLAERIGISLEFVDLKPTSFLKWTERGAAKPRACYIDISRSGAILSNDELIETLRSRFQMHSICHASVLEAYNFESFVSDYLVELKLALSRQGDPEHILFLQNKLIALQPSNLQLVAERAVLHRRIGNFKSSLSDLKRYFSFHEREKSPPEFVSLFDELVQLLDRNRVNIEVLD